jgi:curli biogenesis system outer membrane secretion channel CsgG
MNATPQKAIAFFYLKRLIVVAFSASLIALTACQKSPESQDKLGEANRKIATSLASPEKAVAAQNNAITSPGVGRLESETVSVQGFGVSPGAAVADAMKLAILQVNGVTIENDNVNSKFGLDLALNDTAAIIRGQTFANTMMQRSSGVIQSLVVTELLEPAKSGGFFRVSVNIKVAKFAPSDDLKKIRVVVSTPKFTRDRITIGEQSFTSAEIGKSIRNSVADALTNTGRVAVLDREMNDEVDRELDLIASGNTPAVERAKLSQVASADLVWTARVESMQYVKSSRQLRMSGRELVSFNGSWAISHKLVNVATRQVTLADQIRRTLPSTAPTTLGASINSTKMLADITDEIVAKSVAAILRNVEGYEIVDCELPNPGTGNGQPIRASASECTLRGGVYSLAGQASGESALKIWLPLASQGDKKAQTYVGQIYEKGMGRSADYGRAAEWYKKAADQNYPAAQTALAVLHERGVIGNRPDPAAALALYRKAAQPADGFVPERDVVGQDADRGKEGNNERDKQIADLKAQLEAARNDAKRQGESMKQQQDQIRAVIEQVRRDLSQARAAKDSERVARFERELREREEEEAQSDRKRSSAEAEAARSASALAGINAEPTPVDANLPQIQLIEPVSIAMRGVMTVRIRPELKEVPVIAKIVVRSPLNKIMINDATVTPDAQGIVSAPVSVTGKTTAVQIVAIEKSGKRATLSFVMASTDLVQEPTRASPPVAGLGNYYALVIGNANYKYWESLNTPTADAQAVSALLAKKYGFRVTTLIDASRSRIFKEIARLRSTLNENDNLLIYYSGHGHWDTANLRGYWVPVDAEKENFANYISSSDITEQLGALRARQILVVADACYAGVLVRSVADQLDKNAPPNKADWLQNRAKLQSRKVMSSGGVRQVMDGGAGKHSIFAKQFLDGISRRTDMFEAHELYSEIAPRVEKTARGFGEQQQPQYGQLRFAGHVGGDFLFVPKS